MSKNTTNSHPLTARHHRQIGRRSGAIWSRMRPVWGAGWRPGGHGGSFLGKLFRTLGTPVMMVQVGYQEQGREHVGMFGISARIDPRTAEVSYDNCVLKHDFFYAPFPGAKTAILDTRNSSWVQLGLDVDRVRQRQMERNFILPAVPCMPEIYYGFGSKTTAPFEITPSLRKKAFSDTEVTVTAKTLKGLDRLDSTVLSQQEAEFNALPEETQRARLHAAWDAAFIAPSDPENTTGMWLLPHRYSTAVKASTRVFEYFGGMVGADVFNPARKLGGKTMENKALEIAKGEGVDLEKIVDALATSAEGSPEAQESEDILRRLVPVFKAKQGLADDATEDGILLALVNHSTPLQIELAVQQMEEPQQIAAMRAELPEHIAECCTDEDLLQAVLQPDNALYARGLCKVQALHRNIKVPLAESMRFGPADLDRERVSAMLWYDLPQPTAKPRARRRNRGQRAPQQVATNE